MDECDDGYDWWFLEEEIGREKRGSVLVFVVLGWGSWFRYVIVVWLVIIRRVGLFVVLVGVVFVLVVILCSSVY